MVYLLTACGTDPGVATELAERLVAAPPTTEGTTPSTTDPSPPATDVAPPATDVAPPTTNVAPPTTEEAPDPPGPPTGAPTSSVPAGSLGDRLDVGDAKPARDYDEFVRLALNDIERWWSQEYPATYGERYEPLAGGVYAAYPERTAPIPGCDTDTPTEYRDIAQYSAFYCKNGDFMVYDDGPNGVLAGLAGEFGESILGVVFAHEFGHAIQARAGTLDRDLPTIVSEQQADCFAGAWVAHVRNGGAEGLTFTDDDVRSGLVAMITVRDPIGIDQNDPGGHGSAFDRVGAFQTGFLSGAGALCRARRRPAAARTEHVPPGVPDRRQRRLRLRRRPSHEPAAERPAGVLGRRRGGRRCDDADVDARPRAVGAGRRMRRASGVVRDRGRVLPGDAAGLLRRAHGSEAV